jgi:hypothetical protein
MQKAFATSCRRALRRRAFCIGMIHAGALGLPGGARRQRRETASRANGGGARRCTLRVGREVEFARFPFNVLPS